MSSERVKERLKTIVAVCIAAAILLVGFRASEWVRVQTAATAEARIWMLQQRELMLRQAQQQGLLKPEELSNGENSGTAEADGSGAPPRKSN